MNIKFAAKYGIITIGELVRVWGEGGGGGGRVGGGEGGGGLAGD